MAENDLIVDSKAPDGPFTDEEIVWDETTACAYIDTSMNVISQLDSVDSAMMTKQDQLRVKQMKRWALRIAHYYLKDIYTDLFEQEPEENDQ